MKLICERTHENILQQWGNFFPKQLEMPGNIHKYKGPTSSTKLKSDLKLASDGRKIYAEARKYVQKLGISRGSASDHLCPTFWFLAPPYQNIGLGNNGGVQEEKSFCPPISLQIKTKKDLKLCIFSSPNKKIFLSKGALPPCTTQNHIYA